MATLDNLNERALQLVHGMGSCERDRLDIRTTITEMGCVCLDFGIDRPGSLMGGVLLSEVCMSGLGRVRLVPGTNPRLPMPSVMVETDHPLKSCIASQYAGWPITAADYFAMGSGPGRLLRGCEEILDEYGLREAASQALLVLESDALPTASAVERLGQDLELSPENLTVCVARTASLAGSIQIVARSIETTMHKLHELKFDLTQVKSGVGWAPLPPIGKNDLTSVGWTNDSIIFGATVFLTVDTDDEIIDEIGRQIPSESSSDFGRPFISIFESYDRDFYRIDKMLFSPARVTINNVRTGSVREFGRVHEELLRKSWGF